MTLNRIGYKSYLIRFCFSQTDGHTVAHIRLQNASDANDVHYFADLEAVMAFWLEALPQGLESTNLPEPTIGGTTKDKNQ